MQKLYVITAIFTAANEQFQMFWNPERNCFDYLKPRIMILEMALDSVLSEVASEARSLFGLAGINVPYTVRLVEVVEGDYYRGEIQARTPAGREWVAA